MRRGLLVQEALSRWKLINEFFPYSTVAIIKINC